MQLTLWDLALLLVVSAQATLIAYARQPQAKALLLTLPFPFSTAFLALGRPLDATNILGLALLLLFMHGVRWLHLGGGCPIVTAIAASALIYCLLGAGIAAVLPQQEWVFWTACALVFVLAGVVLGLQPHRDEPPYRSSLPVYVKVPIILAVITLLILSKHWLQGFMTLFPMVGVVAAYEARHSLWTMSRQVPVIMLSLGPMMVAIYLAQPHLGPYGALLTGWLVFAVSLPLMERLKRRL